MKKMIIICLILLAASLLIAQPLPEKVIVGYWHNWGYSPNSMLLQDVSEDFDIIDIAFATPTVPSGSTMTFTPDPGIYPNVDDFIADISYLQSFGKNVLISIGGANDPVSLLTEEDITSFVTSMSNIINTYGFNGVDIDLEGGSVSLDAGDNDFRFPTTARIVNLIEALTQLTDQMPDLLLTCAPETAYVQGGYTTYTGIWGAYLPIIHALRDRWDIVHVQHYNTGSMYGRDGNLHDPATADFHVAMADMLLAGFNVDVWGSNIFFDPLEPEQVAIGLPASPEAAGTGYTPGGIVQDALSYIILGYPFGGAYQLANTAGYEDFRGLMTWSINWDADNDFEFSSSHRLFLDSLSGLPLFPPENVTVEVFGYNVLISWDPPSVLAAYNVYRDDLLIASNWWETFYEDMSVAAGVYTYGVTAIYDAGESEIVEVEDVEVPDLFCPPVNVTAEVFEGNNIMVTWDDPGTAVYYYNIYYDGMFYFETTELEFCMYNLPNGVYVYGITAVYYNQESDIAFSNEVVIQQNFDPPQNLSVDPYTAVFTWETFPGSYPIGFNIFLDDLAQGNTTENQWHYDNLSSGHIYHAGVQAVYDFGASEIIETIFVFQGTAISENTINAQLTGNYPNPFNPSTNIEYYVPDKDAVNITIYNMKGEKVKTLVNGIKPSGSYHIIWNGEDARGNQCASGIFFCKLTNGKVTKTIKLVLLK
ncbi:MAG: T9SS type A sorting domain-containing protein [Candidatus Cloacimonetes bacterium]|nr:T9SS type A sorting domain-containing protein [Candidatus Cloacimonadota bacterium]